MIESDTKITLIGSRLAKEGLEFIFKGEMPECEKCRLRNTCLNLESGRRYRIERIRNNEVHKCFLHEGGVLAVDVSRAPVPATMESRKAVEGARFVYEPPKCDTKDCKEYESCHPQALLSGDKCKIVEVLENIDTECTAGHSLKKVKLGW
ncbi:MAG: UPF0179 family protein [Methanosarcinaceae archaeon]|nr:UPF0179 family protein [Methanosarcinaceae archaeon]MDD4331174.1 UPF0179 family protein [Methanosarcinaceae archaeon]